MDVDDIDEQEFSTCEIDACQFRVLARDVTESFSVSRNEVDYPSRKPSLKQDLNRTMRPRVNLCFQGCVQSSDGIRPPDIDSCEICIE